ncbi:MAG TPA: hypothetical protein DIU07_19585 [Rhodobacteraceae bacterium]|nr:hypothetical protein [Paracoccaceae bacterium]
MLAVIAAGLFWLSCLDNRLLEIKLAGLKLGAAALVLWVTITWFGAPFVPPQWTCFLLAQAVTRPGQARAR